MTRAWSLVFSIITVGFFAALVAVFAWQSVPVWGQEGASYVTGEKWFYRAHQFGVLPMIYGTIVVAGVALCLAAPVGVASAIFTAEYLPRRARIAVKVLIELLAGIPSVVYGLLGILLLRDWVYELFERFEISSGDTLLTAGVLLAVMILPTVVTLSDDALRSVPSLQRRAARALGLNRAETIFAVSLRQSAPGLVSALLLGLGRALGETIAVFLVVGRQDNNVPEKWLSLRPLLDSGQTLTSKLGGSETNIAYGDPLHWAAVVGLGLLLLAIVAGVTFLGVSQRRTADA
ncbi:phosphate ABC transporter permease subunit PstC [Verrucomicrobiota bacterium sgz303538]